MGRQKLESSRWNLIHSRKEKGLTVSDVSRLINYSEATIRLAENGYRYNGKLYNSGKQFWKALSKLYDKPVDWLMKKGLDKNDDVI